MAPPARLVRSTREEYLAAEARSPVRRAFHGGEVFAMAGGSTVHALLSAEAVRLLGNALVGRPCAAAGADARVHIDDNNLTYPDALVVCPPVLRPPGDAHSIANPVVLVEMLSPSTEAWDRGGKFALYARMPSVRHVLLVSQEAWQITHHARAADGGWRTTLHGPGDTVALDALDVRLAVDEVYAKAQGFGGPGPADRPRPTGGAAAG